MPLVSPDFLQDLIFSGIVFNMSWEDPYMDRDALEVGPGDTCVTIVSGGCNTLNLLCWGPDRVYGIDQNAAQTYILELKLAAIRRLDWKDFSDIFGAFDTSRFYKLYRTELRPLLSEPAQKFWDKGRHQRTIVAGMHNAGKNGLFLKLLRTYFQTVLDRDDLERLVQFDDLAEVETFYDTVIEKRIFSTMIRRVCEVGKPYFYLAGVHPKQIEYVERDMPMWDYLKMRVRRMVCGSLPKYNYFLASGGLGRFVSRDAVPPYLQERHYHTLKTNVDRLHIRRGWLHEVLNTFPEGHVTKYSLLDIFDWMNEQQMETVLRAVIRAAADGAKIVYRSGAVRLDPPKPILDALPSSPEQEALAQRLLNTDLCAIYMSFQLRSVDKSKLVVVPDAPKHGPTRALQAAGH